MRSGLLALVSIGLFSGFCQVSHAASPADVEANLDSLKEAAKSSVHADFVETLKAGPAKFQDYECFCRLFVKKGNDWKDRGGAQFSYKYRSLARAVVKSSDYRNGSVVVKDKDGNVRGAGGGALRFVKMNLSPTSPTLQLPTGYSLIQSDFLSLYDAVKNTLAGGGTGLSSSSAVSSKVTDEPVTVLVIKKGNGANAPISELVLIDSKTKVPVIWSTFSDSGELKAMVMFEGLKPNKGLPEDLFTL